MKVLMINKYHFIKGGSERYLFELTGVLGKHGHTVIPFSMKSDMNEPTPYETCFVDNIEFNLDSPLDKIKNGIRIAGRVIYSRQAQRQLERLIKRVKPDIAHLHMIDHQISPSILVPLKDHSIPVIQTVHQYKLICPNYRLYIEQKKQICEKCLGGHFYHAFVEKCHKNSRLASGLVCLESYIHHSLKLFDRIDLFHAPSRFMGEKLAEGGIRQDRIRVQSLSMDMSNYRHHPGYGDSFVFFGRLSGEKGLFTLLDAMKMISDRRIRLTVIGDGPLRKDLEARAEALNLPHVSFTGALAGRELRERVGNARFVVIPSEWYENAPLVVSESFALGKPVIGSRIGGIPELIEEGVNGMLFDPGSAEQLAERIAALYHDGERLRRYGKNARSMAEKKFSWEGNFRKVMSLYAEATG